jgi:hypothetical protein
VVSARLERLAVAVQEVRRDLGRAGGRDGHEP